VRARAAEASAKLGELRAVTAHAVAVIVDQLGNADRDGAEAAGEAPFPTAIGLTLWCELVAAECGRLARGVGRSPGLPDVRQYRSSACAKPSGDRAGDGLDVRRRLGGCGRAG
jgi:hypothetical protein